MIGSEFRIGVCGPDGETGVDTVSLEYRSSVRPCVCLASRWWGWGVGTRNCAGIDWLGRSKLLTQGGDQAENEAEGRSLQEEFHAKSGCVVEGAACLERAHRAGRATPACPQAPRLLIL